MSEFESKVAKTNWSIKGLFFNCKNLKVPVAGEALYVVKKFDSFHKLYCGVATKAAVEF